MTAGNTMRRYMARVDFLLCKETIDSMLAQGFSRKLIHERLISEGRCAMNYITFCKCIRNAKKIAPPPSSRQAENNKPDPPVVRFPHHKREVLKKHRKSKGDEHLNRMFRVQNPYHNDLIYDIPNEGHEREVE